MTASTAPEVATPDQHGISCLGPERIEVMYQRQRQNALILFNELQQTRKDHERAFEGICEICNSHAARAEDAERALSAAESRLAEAEGDAARYRWLREGTNWPAVYGKKKWSRVAVITGTGGDQIYGEELDAAIDAAIVAARKDNHEG